MSSSPPVTITPDDLAWVRNQTNGAPGWTDDQLTVLCQQWTMQQEVDVDSPLIIDSSEGILEPTITVPDLWAAAAMVFEYRLLGLLQVSTTGAIDVRTGDATYRYKTAGDASWLLRSYIKRYWQRADPANRELAHPSGWRTADIGMPARYRLGNVLFGSQIVNGPGLEP